jgi:hypothetical protein
MQEILEVLSPAVLSLEEYMDYVDDVEYAFDNLDLFDQFIDLEYYLDEIIDVTPSRTVDNELLLTFEVDGLSYGRLFSDVVDQAGIYLYGFDEIEFPFDDEWNCIDPLDCEEPDFGTIVAELTTLGSIEGSVKYDPYDVTWVELGLDATDILNEIAEIEYAQRVLEQGYTPHNDNDDITGVNAFTVTVTLENTSAITLPAAVDTDNVNEIVEDVAKFAMTAEAYDILKDYAEYYTDNPLLVVEGLYNTEVYLADIDFMSFSQAFNLEESYIKLVVPMVTNPVEGQPDIPDLLNMDYVVYLEWIDGTAVYDAPVGLEALLPYWLNDDLVSEVAYDTMVGMVNDTNWHMMKLFAYYMWQDVEFDEGN